MYTAHIATLAAARARGKRWGARISRMNSRKSECPWYAKMNSANDEYSPSTDASRGHSVVVGAPPPPPPPPRRELTRTASVTTIAATIAAVDAAAKCEMWWSERICKKGSSATITPIAHCQ